MTIGDRFNKTWVKSSSGGGKNIQKKTKELKSAENESHIVMRICNTGLLYGKLEIWIQVSISF